MAATTLSDVIVPELFNPYVVNKTMELSALYQSGIIANNAEFDRLASEAAPIHNMPFFEDLTGDPEDIIEGRTLTAADIKSSKDVSTTIRRAKMWGATDLAAALAGTDPMSAIGNLVSGFWARAMERSGLKPRAPMLMSLLMAGAISISMNAVGRCMAAVPTWMTRMSRSRSCCRPMAALECVMPMFIGWRLSSWRPRLLDASPACTL